MLIFVQFTCCCSACFAIGHCGRTDPAFRVSSSSSGTGRSAHCSPHCYRLECSNFCPNNFVNILKNCPTAIILYISSKGVTKCLFSSLSAFISLDKVQQPAMNQNDLQKINKKFRHEMRIESNQFGRHSGLKGIKKLQLLVSSIHIDSVKISNHQTIKILKNE